jgi:biotin carboxyl carrier protein
VVESFVIGGRTRDVSVRRDGPRWRVTVDGEAFLVDGAAVDGQAMSLLVDDGRRAGRSVPVVVVRGTAAGELRVALGARTVAVQVVARERSRRRGIAGTAAAGPQRILAPMPGKVVRVLAAPGDEVRERQGLVVVEAMKMENELRATRAGRVVSVAVVEGQSVDAGAVLAVVE